MMHVIEWQYVNTWYIVPGNNSNKNISFYYTWKGTHNPHDAREGSETLLLEAILPTAATHTP